MALPRSCAFVFPATRGDGPIVGFRKFWMKVAKLGTLPVSYVMVGLQSLVSWVWICPLDTGLSTVYLHDNPTATKEGKR